MARLPKYLLALTLLLLGLAGTPAHAISIALGSPALSLSPGGPFTSARDKPVGTVLATSSSTVSASGIGGLGCAVTTLFLSSSPASGNTFTTGVSGIGVNFYYDNGAARTQITPGIQASLLQNMSAPGTLTTVRAELVVTGPISSGTLSALPSVNITFLAVGLGCGVLSLGNQTLAVTAANGTVTALTCQVTQPAITVSLPPVSIQKLATTGATAGATRFTIPLNCASSGANVYVTLTDGTNAANTTSLLTLKPTSTAGNVKLQILSSGGAPVSYGPASAAAGGVGQWLVGPSSTTSGIPLTVQYYSTGTATAGTVQAAAVFTLSYQ